MIKERVKIIGGGCSLTGKDCSTTKEKGGCSYVGTGFGCLYSATIIEWRKVKPKKPLYDYGYHGRNHI